MKRVVLLVVALCIGGCASVMRGTDEPISFTSVPAEAPLSLSNGMSCPRTPCDLKIPRKEEFTATFTKEGFQPESVRVSTHLTGAGAAVGAGNILIGGVIGIGVDAYNGANQDHEPNPVIAHMTPVATAVVVENPKRNKRRIVPVS